MWGIKDTSDYPSSASGKESSCYRRHKRTQVQSLCQEDPLEKEMATHSSILAWKISWSEEPGGLCPCGHKELDMTEHMLLTAIKGVGELSSAEKELNYEEN